MDIQTRRVLQNLDNTLMNLYRNAATQATRKHQRALEQLKRFNTSQFPGASPEALRRAHENYIMQVMRAKNIERSTAQDLAVVGDTAARMIKGESLNLYRLGYNNVWSDLQRQLRGAGDIGNFGMCANFGFYNLEQLSALLFREPESYFTQVAYRNLGLQNARFRKAIEHKLRNTLAEAIMLGEGISEITRRILNITQSEYYRARRIARTETLRVANQGRALAAEQAINEYGIITVKVWISTVDDRTRDDHAKMMNVEADEAGMFHLPGEQPVPYPLHPNLSAENTIHCRCTHIYRISQSRESQAYRELRESMEQQRAMLGGDVPMPTAQENREQQAAMLGAQRNSGIFLENIDFDNKSMVQSTLERHERDIIGLDHEAMVIITPDGNVHRFDGGRDGVAPPNNMDLSGANVTHNHPLGEGDFTFSDEDYNMFFDSNLEVLRGIDEKYIYELRRGVGVAPELPYIPTPKLSHETTQHHLMAIRAREDGVYYVRKPRKP